MDTVVVGPLHLDKNENYFAVNEKCKLFVVCRSNLNGGKIEIKERDISHTETYNYRSQNLKTAPFALITQL